MIITSLEDLQILQQSLDVADAVSAILERPCFAKDAELRDQMRDASSSVGAQMSEGFGQKTDRHFAHYLYLARGSCNEMRAHLRVAKGRKYITASECDDLCERYIRIGKGTTKLIHHLRRDNRKERS